jgi:DNA-binding MarR family transcriptional regulator
MKTPMSRMENCDFENDFSKTFMFSLHQMYFLVQKHLEHVLSKHKSLSFSQFLILVGFHCEENTAVSQLAIAERLNLTEATVSRHISTLVEQGLLSRSEDKANRRKHVIGMTTKGKNAFKKSAQVIHKELDDIFSSIQMKDRISIMKNFSQILTRLLGKK